MTTCFDVAVIGAGLIGASAAYHLSEHCSAVLVEQEPQAGYHSSGRSAAVLVPAYGGPMARALTAASRHFLTNPPEGFAHAPLTTARGAMFIAKEEQLALLDRWRGAASAEDAAVSLSPARAMERVPILNPDAVAAALLLTHVKDIDASALLHGYLKALRARGGELLLDAEVTSIVRNRGIWTLVTRRGELRARTIVNAAGAWADDIGVLAGGARKDLVPTRRTMIVVDGPAGVDVRAWPIVVDAAEALYFKPDGARLVVSPADQTPVPPHDVQAEEWDVAVAVERFESTTQLRVQRVTHRWAGLRTFAPDENALIGLDGELPDFIWAAGLGGYGVQAAHAVGRCCSVLVREQPLPADLAEAGVDLEQLSPCRLAAAGRSPA